MSAMGRRTSSVCTILPTGLPSDAGSRCWRNRNISVAKPLPEIDDCAALLRFAYREALRQHDAAWAHAMALAAPAAAGDIQQYQYPYTPLGAGLFRVRDGNFSPRDASDGAFAQFADAESLWRHNTFSIGRRPGPGAPRRLTVLPAGWRRKMPFHAMIFLGRSQVEPGNQQFVVYHTGPSGDSPGQIKRLSVAQLLNYPDARWRPVTSNPAFRACIAGTSCEAASDAGGPRRA